ncbi:MAG: ABC transporter substrate-binding protein [Elusimicrobiota bacterium]
MNKMIFAVLALLLLCPPVFADEELQKVSVLVETSANKILAALKDKTLEREAKRKPVMAEVDRLFDMERMAKLVLGPTNWKRFDEKQRAQFTELFVRLLKDSYFEKVDLLSDEKIEFGKPAWEEKKIHMSAFILSKDKRYEMIYKLYKKGSGWKAYDVEIEGISVVRSYRSQYEQFLRDGTPQELLVKMKEKSLAAPAAFQKKDGDKPQEKKP